MSRGLKHKEGKLSATYQQQAIGNKGTSCMQTMFSACSFQEHGLVLYHQKEVEVLSNFEHSYSNVFIQRSAMRGKNTPGFKKTHNGTERRII